MQSLKEFTCFESIPTLQDEFKEQGYLFIRSFFPLSLVEQARNRVISVLEAEKWGRLVDGQFLPIEPIHRINSAAFYQCITRLMKEEILHSLAEYPPLCQFLSSLLGEPVFSHPRKMVRITYPYHLNPNDRVPPHQDLFYVKGERDTFTTWIPLGDYPPEQGGLQVAPRTHKRGLLPTQANDEGRFGCNAIEDHLTGFTWGNLHYKLGDLLIMHSLTLHQSGMNESKQFRLSLDCRFSSCMRSINEDQLLPPYYPHVPIWDDLACDWKCKNRFSVPSSLQVHDKNKALSEVLQTETRFAE